MNPDEDESKDQAEIELQTGTGPNDNDLEKRLAALTGAEHFLVGLAPHYWAFIPMLICDLYHLGLVNGVDCMVIGSRSCRFIPVSKCTLMGVVVNVDRKSNGSTLYLIDDGTGLIDCLKWNKSDYYKLPPLVDDGDEGEDSPFQIGDLVRVMGRLRTISVQGIRETRRSKSGIEWDIYECVREVRVTSMGHVVVSNKEDSPRFFCSDPETRHWIKSIEWKENRTTEGGTGIANGADTLRLLGPKIAQQALEKSDFPAADDDVGAWRVFGTSCRCELPYKHALLYCHCQATAEALDPFLIFRDAVLNKLVKMEQEQQSSAMTLQFPYQAILGDSELQKVAKKIGESNRTPVQRLFLKTFAALRKDGVLHLRDQSADIYVLISRSRVIEPHLQKKMAKDKKSQLDYKLLQLERQSILKAVPNSRIQHVKRCLEKGATSNGDDRPSVTARNAQPEQQSESATI